MGKRVAIDAGLNSCFNRTQEESFDFCLNLHFGKISIVKTVNSTEM